MKLIDSPVFTVKDAAEYLKLHPSTIYRMIKCQSIPCFRLGSDWRFVKRELDLWLGKLAIGEGRAITHVPGASLATPARRTRPL
jgi:excisionase family DNA binding protein